MSTHWVADPVIRGTKLGIGYMLRLIPNPVRPFTKGVPNMCQAFRLVIYHCVPGLYELSTC